MAKNNNNTQSWKATIDVQAQPLMNNKITKLKEHKDEEKKVMRLFISFIFEEVPNIKTSL
jgi:hypothetical protein